MSEGKAISPHIFVCFPWQVIIHRQACMKPSIQPNERRSWSVNWWKLFLVSAGIVCLMFELTNLSSLLVSVPVIAINFRDKLNCYLSSCDCCCPRNGIASASPETKRWEWLYLITLPLIYRSVVPFIWVSQFSLAFSVWLDGKLLLNDFFLLTLRRKHFVPALDGGENFSTLQSVLLRLFSFCGFWGFILWESNWRENPPEV